MPASSHVSREVLVVLAEFIQTWMGTRSACWHSVCRSGRQQKESLHANWVGTGQSASRLVSSVLRSHMEVGDLLALWSLLIHHSSDTACSLDIVCTSLLFAHDSLFTAHLTSSLLTFSRETWAPFLLLSF